MQRNPDTDLPPVCAVGNVLWEHIERPKSKDRCLAKGSWESDSLFRLAVLPKKDQSGCKFLQTYDYPKGEECEKNFNAIVDDCIDEDDEKATGGYHPDDNDRGCWEWWIYSKEVYGIDK